MTARAASLWIDRDELPCIARARGVDERDGVEEPWWRWVFRAAISAARRRSDEALGHRDRPFVAMFFVNIPRGSGVVGVAATTRVPQAIVTSFMHRQTLSAAIECSPDEEEVTIVVRTGARVPRPRERPDTADPPATRARIASLRRFGHEFLQRHRRLPTASEVSAALALSPAETVSLLALAHAPVCDEDIALGALPRIRIIGASADRVAQTEAVPATLSAREATVLPMRSGIGADCEATVEEVGRDFAITRERIRPIEARALRKLRHPSNSRRLKDFIDE